MATGGEQGDRGRGSFVDVLVQELVVLLKDFIWRRLERHGIRDALRIREEVGPVELRSPRQEEVSETLQLIGDQVDGDAQLQRILNDPLFVPSKEAFMKVVLAIFSDGKINWGRVVMVFCFACFLVMRAHEKKICDMIRDIIKWTIDYFREKVINWIREQGGWEGILSQVSTPTWQTVMVFLAGVLTALFVMKMK
ncbi:apoptosis regulator BAX [Fundulus heteroclitus]|uniref:BCL2 associated X, apoptosis regulator a n=1 Tax=Fundulus heteroclitus TaxID=8078 RepID=A0A3Q2NZ80_FUNHE|nr:apoptosis regulator BAX [Fundulus heteroclitus]